MTLSPKQIKMRQSIRIFMMLYDFELLREMLTYSDVFFRNGLYVWVEMREQEFAVFIIRDEKIVVTYKLGNFRDYCHFIRKIAHSIGIEGINPDPDDCNEDEEVMT